MKNAMLVRYFICLVFYLFAAMSYAETMAIGGPIQAPIPPNDVMTVRIQQAIQQNHKLAGLSETSFQIAVNQGIVSIAGTIPTEEQAVQLVQTIASVKDVRDVFVDQLSTTQVSPNLADLLITARVKGAIVRQKIFGKNIDIDHIPIGIQTNQGIVFLSGVVDNRAQLDALVTLIQLMRSVPRVISMLTVRAYTVRM